MSTMLDEIIAVKRGEVAERKAATSLAGLQALATGQTPPRGFRAALEAKAATGYRLIADIQKTPPSKGARRPHLEPPAPPRP